MDWSESCLAIELDDGTVLYASRDDEGNGPGALRGVDSKGTSLIYPVI